MVARRSTRIPSSSNTVPADRSPALEPIQLDVQFNPATIPWPRLRDGAALADRAGFGAIWAFDHLAGSSVNGDTMLEAFSLLGALAAVTERVALGTLVLNVAHRRPAITAVGAASISTISGRPFYLGLGAGASPASPWADRVARRGSGGRAVAGPTPRGGGDRHPGLPPVVGDRSLTRSRHGAPTPPRFGDPRRRELPRSGSGRRPLRRCREPGLDPPSS